MPEIDRDALGKKLGSIPEQDREPYLQALRANGYTWKSNQPPSAMSQAFQKAGIEPSKFQMAKQAIDETLSEDLPYAGGAVGYLRDVAPGKMAEAGGKIGFPKLGASSGMATAIAGTILPKTGGELLLQGVAGPVLEGLGAASKYVGTSKPVMEAVQSMSSKLTGIESPFIKRAFERGAEVAVRMKTLGQTDIVGPIVEQIKKSITEGRQLIGKRISQAEDYAIGNIKYAGVYEKQIPTADIGQKLEDGLTRAGFSTKTATEDVTIPLRRDIQNIVDDFKNIQGGREPIPDKISPLIGPSGRQIITPGSPGIPARPVAMTFKSALNTRRKIDRMIEFIEAGSLQVGSVEEAILKQARKELNDRLRNADPNFRRVNDAAAKFYQSYEALRREVLSGQEDTVARRIANIFKKGSVERKILSRLDEHSKDAIKNLDSLIDTFAAQKLKPVINPALSQSFQRTGGGAAGNLMKILAGAGAYAHPEATAIAGGAGALLSSPRANFAALQALKKWPSSVADILSSGGAKISAPVAVKIPATLQRLLRKQGKSLQDTYSQENK